MKKRRPVVRHSAFRTPYSAFTEQEQCLWPIDRKINPTNFCNRKKNGARNRAPKKNQPISFPASSPEPAAPQLDYSNLLPQTQLTPKYVVEKRLGASALGAIGGLIVLTVGYTGACYSGVPVPWFVGRVEPSCETRQFRVNRACRISEEASIRPTISYAASRSRRWPRCRGRWPAP